MAHVGQKIRMEGEKQRYTVQAADKRYIVMTKPFNARRTYLYTIADLERGVRGPCNLIFGLNYDVNSHDGAANLLAELNDSDLKVSYRKCVDLLPSEIAQLTAPKEPTS